MRARCAAAVPRVGALEGRTNQPHFALEGGSPAIRSDPFFRSTPPAYTARTMRARHLLAAFVSVPLLACSSTPAATDDAGSDAPAADAGSYLPTGYAQVPFLSDQPVHTFKQADQVIDVSKDYVAVLDTDVGRIVMHLESGAAPITCNSFVFLTLHHFYDGVAFHRVIDNFMAQTGDPNSISGAPSTWGTGGCGYTFGLEVTPSLNYDAPGVVGMARATDPNSNGSQFFITFTAYPSLNQQYTVWAKVIEGLDTLPNIVRGEPPANPTRIVDAYIGVM
jgi:peptidylprolyl isomerase